MSDGEVDATPGHCRGAHDRQPPSPVALSAAPWERFTERPIDDSVHRWQIEPPAETRTDDWDEPVETPARSAQSSGSHASGALSVADLIAKVGAHSTGIRHRRAALDDDPDEDDSDVSVAMQET